MESQDSMASLGICGTKYCQMKSVSGSIVNGAENGASVKSQTMQTWVYQAGKSDLGAEDNEVALKGLHEGTSKSDRYFQLTDTSHPTPSIPYSSSLALFSPLHLSPSNILFDFLVVSLLCQNVSSIRTDRSSCLALNIHQLNEI